ncbi:hypothetical protein B9Q04_19550, partial [Candidatus Marsarchaeota G2 archaeon BE_D]
MQLNVRINRDAEVLSYDFKEIFEGFEKVEAVRRIFGDKTDEVLSRTKVVLFPRKGYLAVDDENGYILVSKPYLKTADERYIYLDVIHELVHVRQFLEGKNLFDERYSYVDRPTEVEAYRLTVEEARRIGMDDKQIAEYLYVEWITQEEYQRLLHTLGVNMDGVSKSSGTRRRGGWLRQSSHRLAAFNVDLAAIQHAE